MSRNYWLDLFTGKTWEEFLRNGASVSGFKERRRNIAKRIRPGDYLICYLTGLYVASKIETKGVPGIPDTLGVIALLASTSIIVPSCC